MALSLAKAAPLKPAIKLAQALSEFEAVLPDDQKKRLRLYRGQSPPNPTDVMRFTAEVDSRNRKSRQCVGPRLTNVLHAVQQFSTIVDPIVGSSQSQIAGAIWGTVKLSLQLASAVSSYFDQLSTLFMRIGRTCPRYQDFGLLYPESTRLQSALCDYFVVFVRLCKQAVLFLKKPFWSQLPSTIIKPFESEFGGLEQDLENIAFAIRDEVCLASNQGQQNEAKEMSMFRALTRRNIGEASTWKRKKAVLRFLDACSVYNHEKSWKQARKQGNTNWICHDEGYKQWKREKTSNTLWCTGILGSGKTVMSANVVEDLMITTPACVAYFFCRFDEAESLETRTIIGSIARQMFDHIKLDMVADAIAEMNLGIIDTDQILDFLQKLFPSNSHSYFIVIDGLDECEKKEIRLVFQCLKQLLTSKQVFQVYCSSRPDVFHWAHTLLEPQWNVSMMSRTSADIKKYVEDALVRHLEAGSLSVGDSTIILAIQDSLLENAHGMFLWVAFQIDSICSQETDEAILTVLKDLPKDLPHTFNRILRKLQPSNAADPPLCRKVFDLLAAAHRPLTVEELREAVSVKPGETSWDESKLANDMLRTLLNSCGSLVAVDEEHLTVHFAHQSIKQHLLSEPIDSDMRKYHINMKGADLYLGGIIVTYLNFGIFDRQLVKTKSTTKPTTESAMLPQVETYPSAIIGRSLPRSNLANRLAVRLLKTRGTSRLDVHTQYNTPAKGESREEAQPAHLFLRYAQEFWLLHTKLFKSAGEAEYTLWQRLTNGEVKTIELPLALKEQAIFDDQYTRWIIQNEHWALIDQTLVRLAEAVNPDTHKVTKPLLELLEKKATDIDGQNINLITALYLASYFNHKAVVLLSLEKRADINAHGGWYGTALQVASNQGHEAIVRLLLENGANVNAEGELYGTALKAASKRGHEATVRLLLENGADVNAKGEIYGNALQAASERGHEATVRLLLENGADVNAESGDFGTALRAASSLGYEEMARLLLENGANVNAKGGKFGTALEQASRNGHEAIARLLLENGADVNAESGDFGTALLAASSRGNEKMARLLLENGANVNAESGIYGNALQAASERGHEATARLLLENGADVNAESGRFGTALQAASERGHEAIARLTLKYGANVNAKGGNYGTALQAASERGHEAIVRLLLENGADVNAESGRFGTALQVASFLGDEKMARLLLKNGANVNTKGGNYGNALQAASERGHEAIVRLLLENGADVNAESGDFGTALRAASSLGYEEMARLLLENGADVNAESGLFGTALQAASFFGYEVIARLLLENGANVNLEGGYHDTALQEASKQGHNGIVRLLLENGAEVNAESGHFGTALQAASFFGYEEIARLLLENGADVNAERGRFGTALQAASSLGYEKIARLLLENGANINAKGGKFGTALEQASRNGHNAIVRLLLENGADVNAKGEKYGTALEEASKRGHEAIVGLLRENGAR